MTTTILGRRWLVALLLVAALLSLSFSHGYGRRVKTVRYHGRRHTDEPSNGSSDVPGRKTVEVVSDYDDPKANTNPRNGDVFFNPPPSPPAPPPTNPRNV